MMKKASFTWVMLILFSLISPCALIGTTHQTQDLTSDVLAQLLGLVQDMKSQLGNLQAKVVNLDEDMKQIKIQTLSSTEIMKDQLKGVKTQVLSAVEDLKDTFDGLCQECSSAMMDVLNDTIETLESAVTESNAEIQSVDADIKTLQSQMQALHGKFDAPKSNESESDNRFNKVLSLLLNFEDPRFEYPDVSHVWREKLYLVAKEIEIFDIDKANEVCHEYGGYLVEFEDEEEYDFILGVSKGAYVTGYTDRNIEGKFVHIDSGKDLSINKWDRGEPNNYSREDCVEVLTVSLNDMPCDDHNNRYICEI